MYFARGNLVHAEQELVSALRQGQDPREVIPLLLQVCVHDSRLIGALGCARTELRRAPHDAELRYLTAALHMALGQNQDARAELELLLVEQPTHAIAHYLLGVLASGTDAARAREHFAAFLDLAPHSREPAGLSVILQNLRPRLEIADT
jgi:predicted Zn-dependent protease